MSTNGFSTTSSQAETTSSNGPTGSGTPAPLPTFSTEAAFTGDQVTALVAGLLRQLQINPTSLSTGAADTQNASPVTANSFPQFIPPVNLPPSSGMSLLDLFPSVKASVLLDISRHDFEPSDLYKLDSKFRDKSTRSVLDFNGKTFTLRDPSTKDYPTFHSLHTPLLTYFDILVAFASSSGDASATYHVSRGAFQYLTQLAQFYDDYQWGAVLSYHMEFHHKRRREMVRGDYSGWAQIDPLLQAQHLTGKERARMTPGATRTHTPPGKVPANAPPKDHANEVCNLFNRGACTSPCRYKRLHKCLDCSSTEHGQNTCTKKTT
ncbi:hypothetical protein FKP32DRAFT_1569147 [Trametes sanguinea]|nr:hypothetical protein FKP32DRAFT_1569147 [Trametes sanguinea]